MLVPSVWFVNRHRFRRSSSLTSRRGLDLHRKVMELPAARVNGDDEVILCVPGTTSNDGRMSRAAYPVLGRKPSPWTTRPGVDQHAPQHGPADVDALSLAQQLAQMGVVGPGVPGTGQTHYASHHGIGCCVARPPAPVAMSYGGNALLSISCHDASGVASGDTHQRRCLVSKPTVQNLKPCLFFLSQCHILHKGSVTFMLASWSGPFR